MGLNVPQITQLMAVLRDKGVDVPKNIYTVDAAVDAVKRLIGGNR